MSNDTHSHSDRESLSDFEVLLATARFMTQPPIPTPGRLLRHLPESSNAIIKRIKELAVQENAYSLKYRQISSKRRLEDAEVEQSRTEEDEKYQVILAARASKEKQCMERRAAEDAKLRKHERTLDDKEDARCFIRSYGT
jgi:hypothetical protein